MIPSSGRSQPPWNARSTNGVDTQTTSNARRAKRAIRQPMIGTSFEVFQSTRELYRAVRQERRLLRRLFLSRCSARLSAPESPDALLLSPAASKSRLHATFLLSALHRRDLKER